MKFEKPVEWDPEKNKILIGQRDIAFEAVVVAIENGHLLDILPNPSSRHANQRVYVVDLNQRVVLVPFVEDDDKIFLKTAFVSRKVAKQYRGSR